jgi:hypothetical protein
MLVAGALFEASALEAATASWYPVHGELRDRARDFLAFDSRQRGSNQPPMYGTVVTEGWRGPSGRRRGGHRGGRSRRGDDVGPSGGLGLVGRDGARQHDGSLFVACTLRSSLHGNGLGGQWDLTFLFAADRHLGSLEFVFGVARRAPGLSNRVLDHCDDGVIGQSPLARTIVVDDVTDP